MSLLYAMQQLNVVLLVLGDPGADVLAVHVVAPAGSARRTCCPPVRPAAPAAPVGVEQPVVVATAQAGSFGASEGEGGTAVRALLGEQPEPALAVPEQNKILPRAVGAGPAPGRPCRAWPPATSSGAAGSPSGAWSDRGQALVFSGLSIAGLPGQAVACGTPTRQAASGRPRKRAVRPRRTLIPFRREEPHVASVKRR